LTHLTVISIIKSFELFPEIPRKIFVCGGGSKNATIINGIKNEIAKLKKAIPGASLLDINIENFLQLGDADFVEAQAFGYLAVRYLKNLASSFPTTTGINQEILSGVLFHL
ncbi:MAG: anhydro-N-acetylmuramic acid kinase, partial [Janthinobacterium lividum]